MKDKNIIKTLMQQLQQEKHAPAKFAVAYVDFMAEHGKEIISYLKNVPKYERNLTLIDSASSLARSARRLVLVSDLFVFGETSSTVQTYFHYDPQTDDPEFQKLLWGTAGIDSGDWEPSFYITTRNVYTSDWEALRTWLQDMQNFLKAGKAIYLPRIKSEYKHVARNALPPEEVINPLFDKANYIVSENPTIKMESPLYAPLFHLEIPCIDLVDGGTLYQICEDERDSLSRLRDTFFLAFVEAEKAWGSDSYEAQIMKVQKSIINEGLRQIRSDMDTLRAKRAIQAVGAAIGYIALTIYIILGTEPLIKILGPTGISYSVQQQIVDYMNEVKKVREKPMYFLWKLENKIT